MNVKNRILINVLLCVFTYLIPIYVFIQHKDDYKNINFIQIVTFATLFLGASILIYINRKNRIQIQKLRWVWQIFQFIGILGFCYSLVILFTLFLLRNCCGF